MNVHQRLHRDGIQVWPIQGETITVHRTGSGVFRCNYPECIYYSKDACNYQVSTAPLLFDRLGAYHIQRKRHCQSHRKKHEASGTYMTPSPTPTIGRSARLSDEDTVMGEEDLGNEPLAGGLATFDVEMVEIVETEVDGGTEHDPDVTLVDETTVGDNDSLPDVTLVDETTAGEDDPLMDTDSEGNKGHDEEDGDGDEDDGDGDEDDGDYKPCEGDGEDIPRAEWSDEMRQTDEMMRLGLCINTAFRVAVCIACRSVIKPSELFDHITRTHSMSTTRSFCQALWTEYNLQLDPYNVRPGSVIKAIFGLDLVEGYIACDSCGYACGTQKAMDRHIKKSDGCETFRKRYVQSYRSNSKRMYFGVELEPVEESLGTSLDPLDYLKKKFAPIPFSNIPIKYPASARDVSLFLREEKWHEYVEGKTGREIVDAVRERVPELRGEIRNCVDRYTAKLALELNKVDHEPRAAMADYYG